MGGEELLGMDISINRKTFAQNLAKHILAESLRQTSCDGCVCYIPFGVLSCLAFKRSYHPPFIGQRFDVCKTTFDSTMYLVGQPVVTQLQRNVDALLLLQEQCELSEFNAGLLTAYTNLLELFTNKDEGKS